MVKITQDIENIEAKARLHIVATPVKMVYQTEYPSVCQNYL